MDKTLRATPDIQRVVDELVAKKRISRSVVDYARANGYSDTRLIETAERNRAIKARMAVEGSPALYRRQDVANPNDPTPQWQSKAGALLRKDNAGRGDVVPLKKYRVRSIVDQYGDKFEHTLRSALERFLQDADYTGRVRVADLNPSGGSAPGKRLGGLGNVPDIIRVAHARHQWICGRLSPELLKTGDALVLREMSKPDGTPFSMEDFGAHIIPSVIDKNRRWGVAAGALWAFAAELVFWYALCPHRMKWMHSDDAALES